MDTNTRPLVQNNPYPTLEQQNTLVVGLAVQNNMQTNYDNPYYQNQNQGYPPSQQNYQPNKTPYQVPSYPQQQYNQGFQPVPPGQYRPPPPPPQQQTQVVIQLPGYISANHPKYRFIMEQSILPCPVCRYQGVDYVSLTPGCAAYSWSICLFCFTGILCFWIPFVCDGCKDIKVSCSKCRRTKCIIQKPCC